MVLGQLIVGQGVVFTGFVSVGCLPLCVFGLGFSGLSAECMKRGVFSA